MILKSFEIKKNKKSLLKSNFFLLYGENLGLKKDIKNFFTKAVNELENDIETLSFYESDIIKDESSFINLLYSGSLFSKKKIVTIYDASDKIVKKIEESLHKYSNDIFLIFFSDILEKKSKLRNLFEKESETICIPCYLDSEKDLLNIAQLELEKNKIILSRESINLLIEKSNADRNNLRNEIEKIISYSFNKKKIEFNEIESLINFSGDYKSDIMVNECLSGNLLQYKKIISELYTNTVNQVLLLRILSSKIHRLLKIKEQETETNSLDNLINVCKPPIFWKEKPIIKKQLSIWKLNDLKKIIEDINNTEFMCKKNPQISNSIFFSFFSKICKKANNYSL